MSTGLPPNIHPCDRLTTPAGDVVDIDREIAPLVSALWKLGLTTLATCQDFGDGTAGLRELEQRPPRYGGDAFIAYWRGYAWLKMPTNDATILLNALLNTALGDHVRNRWQPESWRLHVPLIYEAGYGIDLAAATQIHFPRSQIAELTDVLADLHRNESDTGL
jgi:hypothetical protein